MRTCEIPDCKRDHMGRGMCVVHYARWRRHGSTDKLNLEPALPNPWRDEAPACPRGCPPLRVYLWAAEGKLRWMCATHALRFDAPTSRVPCGASSAEGTLVVGSVDSP